MTFVAAFVWFCFGVGLGTASYAIGFRNGWKAAAELAELRHSLKAAEEFSRKVRSEAAEGNRRSIRRGIDYRL